MRHFIGLDEALLKQRQESPVLYDPSQLLNQHALICGMSGSGKSWQTKRLLDTAAGSGVEVDVFDVHEELDHVNDCVAVKYSQATGYGFNPLILDTDRHSGGVIRQASFLVGLVKEVTPQMGPIQATVLQNLIVDTYAAAGIFPDSPDTWVRRNVTEYERNRIVASGRFAELRQYYPTLADLRSYANRKLMALTIGGDDESVTEFDALVKLTKSYAKAQRGFGKAVGKEELAKMEEKVNLLKNRCIESYASAVTNQQTGRELEDIMKYDSAVQLQSLLARIDALNTTGIFRANEPPFKDSKVRVHQIKSLSLEQQILFVKVRLRAIFKKCVDMGPTRTGTEIRHVVFLDEAHKFFSPGGDDIISVIARESRKYGLGLWMASQSPVDFPEAFSTNVGATILLGIHSAFWKRCQSTLRISEGTLTSIRPKEVLAIKLQKDGESDPQFVTIAVPNPKSFQGKRAEFHQTQHEARERAASRAAPPAAAKGPVHQHAAKAVDVRAAAST